MTGFGIVRLNSNGEIDSSFGLRGLVVTAFPGTGPGAATYALAVQPNGEILAAGQAGNSPSFEGGTSSFALARYTSAGQLDSTFGSGGRVTTNFNNLAFITGLVLQSDGKIVAAGNSNSGNYINFTVARCLGQ